MAGYKLSCENGDWALSHPDLTNAVALADIEDGESYVTYPNKDGQCLLLTTPAAEEVPEFCYNVAASVTLLIIWLIIC